MYDFGLSKDQEQRAKDLHAKAIVIDGLTYKDGIGLTSNGQTYPKDTERMHAGGITAASHTVAIHQHSFLDALKEIDGYKQGIYKNEYLSFAKSVEDIKKAKREGKVAIIFSFQDGKPIEDDQANLRTFKQVGIRIIQLTYNAQNLIGTGCCERDDSKLSYFGVEVVEEMNRLGMLIDVSHCGDATTMDAIELSKDPIVFSHSGVRALCNAHARNKTDEQIKALAEKNGVMGINWHPAFVKRDPKTHKVLRSTVDDVLNHLDYAVKLVGVDYVGFGTDLYGKALDQEKLPWYSSMPLWRAKRPDVFGVGPTDGTTDPYPVGLERHSETPNLTRGLVARGYSDQEILKILGGNFLRIFERVWKE